MRLLSKKGLLLLVGLLLGTAVLLLALLYAAAQAWLSQQQLEIVRLKGLSLSPHGMTIEQLRLRHRQCRTITAGKTTLNWQDPAWQLQARTLHWQDRCPAGVPSVPAPAVTLPPWLPALTLQIEQLSLAGQPPLRLSGRYRPAGQQWQLQLHRGQSEQLLIRGSIDNQQCLLSATWAQTGLQLAGTCPSPRQLSLQGQLSLAQTSLPLQLALRWPALTLHWQSQETPLGPLQGRLLVELEQRRFTLRASGGRDTADWQLDSDGQLGPAGQLEGTLTLAHAPPGGTSSSLQASWSGSLREPTLEIASGSRLVLPLDAQLVTLQAERPWQLRYQQQQLQWTGSGRWSARLPDLRLPLHGMLDSQGALTLEQLALSGTLELSGRYPLAEEGQVEASTQATLGGTLSAPQLTLPAGPLLSVSKPAWQAWRAEDLSVALRQPLTLSPATALPPLPLQLELTRPLWQGRPLPPLSARLRLSPAGQRWDLGGTVQAGSSELAISGQVATDQLALALSTDALPLAELAPLLAPLEQPSGELSARGTLRWRRNGALRWQATGKLVEAAGVHPLGLLAGADIGFDASDDGTSLTVAGDFTVAEINPGIPLHRAVGHYHLRHSEAGIRLLVGNLTARLLGGSLIARSLRYPAGTTADTVQLNGLSLEEIVQLQQQAGLRLTGKVDAILPVRLTREGVAIHNGRLSNQGPLQLALLPTPTVEQWLNRQPQLAQVGQYLRQLQIDTLQAELDLAPDGLLVLDSRLRGHNPGLGQRPVQLNYHHEENLLDLLTSLRMSDRFSQAIEQHLNRQPQGGPSP